MGANLLIGRKSRKLTCFLVEAARRPRELAVGAWWEGWCVRGECEKLQIFVGAASFSPVHSAEQVNGVGAPSYQ